MKGRRMHYILEFRIAYARTVCVALGTSLRLRPLPRRQPAETAPPVNHLDVVSVSERQFGPLFLFFVSKTVP